MAPRKPPAPRDPPMPKDLAATLRAEGLLGSFKAITPGKRREILRWVSIAVRDETRAKRIERAVHEARAAGEKLAQGPHVFKAEITRVLGGHGVEVPEAISDALDTLGRVPVVVRIGKGKPFRATLMPRGGGRHGLFLNAQARAGARSGKVDVEVRVERGPREVPVPEDLADALDEEGVREAWGSLPPGKREHILRWVDDAAHESTRVKRIARAVEEAAARREKLVDRAARREARPAISHALVASRR